MNGTLMETLTKLTIEKGIDWVMLLLYTIFRAHNIPYVSGLTPFEIMYGAPPPIVPGTLTEQSEQLAPNYLTALEALRLVQEKIWPFICSYYSQDEQENPEHSIKPGDWICVKRQWAKTLEGQWKSSYIVLVNTPIAFKVDGIGLWVHHSFTH